MIAKKCLNGTEVVVDVKHHYTKQKNESTLLSIFTASLSLHLHSYKLFKLKLSRFVFLNKD